MLMVSIWVSVLYQYRLLVRKQALIAEKNVYCLIEGIIQLQISMSFQIIW